MPDDQPMIDHAADLAARIRQSVTQYYRVHHARKAFVPGKSRVQYAGRVFDEREMLGAMDAVLEFNLTAGRFADQLERALKIYFRTRRALLVNSGSSANLLMVATLCGNTNERPLRDGDEVITPATTFPTTLAPILQNRLVPVFVDCGRNTYNMELDQVVDAIGPGTRAIFVPHTVGSPWHLAAYRRIAEERGLYLLEDGCDALGATYDGKPVGSFGDMSSLSFYPAHQMTMGEGGAVMVNNRRLVRTALSVRDWGRDCWCAPGKSNTCGSRFACQFGGLPAGYDHKYVYSNIGYNLKVTDLQAAIGLEQFAKVPDFVAARRRNYDFYRAAFADLSEHLEFAAVDPRANPSWFGFPFMVRDHVDRLSLVRHLEDSNIETRQLFGGNILLQPGYQRIAHRAPRPLAESDRIMNQALFIGVYPGLTDDMRDYVVERMHAFFKTL